MITIEFGKAEKQTLDKNSLFIKMYGSDFRQSLERLKNYWNRIYIPNSKEWEIPYSCFEEIKQVFSDTEIKYLNDPPKAHIVTESDIIKDINFNGYNLFDYQLEGVEFGLNHHNFLLLDEQGLGKTLQAITIARYKKLHNKLEHCLIVCGVNSLKSNWLKEIEKFCNNENGIILGTKINSRGRRIDISIEETKQQIDLCPKEFFWIINIEKMRLNKGDTDSIVSHLNTLIDKKKLGMLVVDEVHKIRNLDTAQAQGLMTLDKTVDKMLMSGTILVNNPYDLYCPMSLCGLINYSKWQFENKFVIKDEWRQVKGYKNMDELHEILFKSSLRRTKDLLTLPDKIYKQEWLEFSKEEQSVFNQIIGAEDFKLDKIPEPFELMAQITRMRQSTVAAELLTSSVTKSTKFDRLNDILEEARVRNQKVLVFCPFTQALELGLKYCQEYKPKLVKGGMNNEIQKVVESHEQTNGFSVLFAQEATLGVGFTLTNTEICVFLSPPWTRSTYDQCSDRIHRIGQKHTVQIIDLLIKDTYDELIYKKLHGKGAMADKLIDNKEGEDLDKMMKDAGINYHKKEVEDKPVPKLFEGIYN